MKVYRCDCVDGLWVVVSCETQLSLDDLKLTSWSATAATAVEVRLASAVAIVKIIRADVKALKKLVATLKAVP